MTPEEKQLARKIKADQEAVQRVRLYREVFGSPNGQLVLRDLWRAHGMTARVFTLADRGDHVAYDPLKAALKDGSRDVLIRIQEILETNLQESESPKPKVKK